ncbi:DmsC/YnfH family molybdoenzyme membrane anchor subunit [Eggerthella lenta]|uniref:dimethyl sulfoxide reductase anchor subunit family protein n=3 Tax=Eggerthellaceae TaxID=1643826 RepID=UPI001F2925AA|nr:DmsC/YnfH family molybdoenzyme membrane anchor subunit [Eggerthella lenta]
MELQWPLIVFTTLVAWSAGLFGTQALMAAFGVGKKAQVPAWIASAVLLAVGGIAVFFHLEHWERIFNGFGHLTSGITQELIAIVVLAAVAVAYLVMLRKSDDGASVPKWLAWLSVALSVALVAVMAHSYTMAARPAWDSVLWILYVLGNACVLGPATFAFLMAAAPPAGQPAGRAADAGAPAGLAALVGAAANALAALAFAIFLQLSAGSFADVGYYFDPTHPTEAMADCRGDGRRASALLWLGAVAVGAIVPPRRPSWAGAPATGGSGARWLSSPPWRAPSACAWPSTTSASACSCSTRMAPRAGPAARPPARPRERRPPGALARVRRGDPLRANVPRETSAAKERMFHVKHPGSAPSAPLRPRSPLRARFVSPNPLANDGSPSKRASGRPDAKAAARRRGETLRVGIHSSRPPGFAHAARG